MCPPCPSPASLAFGFLAVLLVSSCASVPAVDSIFTKGVVQVAVADFEGGSAGRAMASDLRDAISSQDLFIIVDPERTRRVRDRLNSQAYAERWTPIDGADAIIMGVVRQHEVSTGESLLGSVLGSDEPTAVVDVVIEIIDLRSGEVYGTRRITQRVGPLGDPISTATRLIKNARGEHSDTRLSEQQLLRIARQGAASQFVDAIRPDYSRR